MRCNGMAQTGLLESINLLTDLLEKHLALTLLNLVKEINLFMYEETLDTE